MNIESVTASGGGFSIDKIKEVMDGLDPAELLPDLNGLISWIVPICRIAILVGPILLLALGISYLLLSPKEANHYFGYTTYFGMGSVNAWRYSQKIAGVFFGGSGLILTIVALFIASGFGGGTPMDVVWRCFSCLGWQLGVSFADIVIVNLIMFFTYDRKGRLRRKKA